MNAYNNQSSRPGDGEWTAGGPAEGPAQPASPAPGKFAVLRKSPALATVLSLMPGLGQIYVGYYQQGFLFILAVATCISILEGGPGRGAEPFFGLFLSFLWIFNMIDANRRAQHYNLVLQGLPGEEVPESFKVPGAGGSIFTGVLLIAVGFLLFLDVKFGVSLEWVEDWWPLALVGFGVWLVVKSRRRGA